MVQLATEKYRPQTLAEYVFKDPLMKTKFEEHIAKGSIPNLVFHGGPGTGKTSLAYLILKLLGIPAGDILFIPASRMRKVDEIESKIVNFCSTWSLNPTGIKYVIFDEFDALSMMSQKFLRTEMEVNSDHCRFIFTCNYIDKIIPALLEGRTQVYAFVALDKDEFITRAGEIMTLEGVEFDVEDLFEYCNKAYPDLRKCISLMDKNTVGGKLYPYKEEANEATAADYILEMVTLFKAGRYKEARTLVAEKAAIEEYPSIYRYFYENLHIWGETEDQKDEALLIIRRALVNHAMVADPEINLAAAMVELIRVIKS